MQKTQLEWNEFIEARNNIGGEYIDQTTNSNSLENWKPPTGRVIKINSDAIFSKTMNKNGIGAVARDGEGRLMKT